MVISIQRKQYLQSSKRENGSEIIQFHFLFVLEVYYDCIYLINNSANLFDSLFF